MNPVIAQAPRYLTVLCSLLSVLIVAACGQEAANSNPQTNAASPTNNAQGALWRDVPEKIDVGAKYLFYLHGAIVENEGTRPVSPEYGVYEYEQILDTFVKKGFVVISEARPRGTDAQQYALKVVEQVNRLIRAGAPPQKIAVVGASRGGAIAVLASTLLKNRDVNFVVLAACGNSSIYRNTKVDLWGNILSIYDFDDVTGAGTCQSFFDNSTGVNRHKEIVLRLGIGHGIVYRPLKEWVDPTADWASQL
jgi:hypothetical protein